jgi:hypothetical protein
VEDWIVPLAGMLTSVILLYPLVRGGVRFLERKTGGGARSEELEALRQNLRLLQDRMDSIDLQEDRVTELEERVDFAERMLAQQREVRQIGDGE